MSLKTMLEADRCDVNFNCQHDILRFTGDESLSEGFSTLGLSLGDC